MNTKTPFKSKEESVSLDFQDSNLKVNKDNNNSTSALISKGEISMGNHNSTEKSDPGCPLPKSKDIARGRSIRTIINPIVETNLKAVDLDFLSTEMGDEIARIVVDEIVSLQSHKYGAITR